MPKSHILPIAVLLLSLVLPSSWQANILAAPEIEEGQPRESAAKTSVPPMPEVLWFKEAEGYPHPVFVASSLLKPALSGVRPELLSPASEGILQTILSLPQEHGCIQDSQSVQEEGNASGNERKDFRSTVKSSQIIVRGRVTGLAAGFSHGQLGMLVRTQVEETIKGDSFREEFLVFVPAGEVWIGEHRICKTDYQWADLPAIGDSVLLLFSDNWYNRGPLLNPGGATGFITLKVGAPAGKGIPRRFQAQDLGLVFKTGPELVESIHKMDSAGGV